jgi:hypothetical protein
LNDAVLRVINDVQLRQSMAKESFELFKMNFHASAMAERVEQVYDNVVHR